QSRTAATHKQHARCAPDPRATCRSPLEQAVPNQRTTPPRSKGQGHRLHGDASASSAGRRRARSGPHAAWRALARGTARPTHGRGGRERGAPPSPPGSRGPAVRVKERYHAPPRRGDECDHSAPRSVESGGRRPIRAPELGGRRQTTDRRGATEAGAARGASHAPGGGAYEAVASGEGPPALRPDRLRPAPGRRPPQVRARSSSCIWLLINLIEVHMTDS